MVARVHLAPSEPEMARDRQMLGAPSTRYGESVRRNWCLRGRCEAPAAAAHQSNAITGSALRTQPFRWNPQDQRPHLGRNLRPLRDRPRSSILLHQWSSWQPNKVKSVYIASAHDALIQIKGVSIS